jgi:hypothetical protein
MTPQEWVVWADKRIAELEADHSGLREQITNAERHLVNLQPHIAQLPEQYQLFIDTYVDLALECLRGK